jgi:5'-nucleotidase
MKWDWIFFDADETLFTFDSFSGLQRMFLDYSVTFSAEDFQDYQAVNKPLWVDYQNGAITRCSCSISVLIAGRNA